MSESNSGGEPAPFVVRDCTMTALATGLDARNLREFRDRLERIPDGSLYYHFWGRLLRPVFEPREYNNDFANWAFHALRDRALGERLALVDPADFTDMDRLRQEVLDIVGDRLAQRPEVPWATSDEAFHFIRGQLVVFDTHRRLERPDELADLCPTLSPSSVYYHFMDARYRSPEGIDDFQHWLRQWGDGYAAPCEDLSQVDLSFTTLPALRDRLHELLLGCFGNGSGS